MMDAPNHALGSSAAAAVAKLPSNARLLASDSYGGYLIYRFDGRRKVYFDGRSDFYGAGFMKQYLILINARPGWQEVVRSSGFTHALLPDNSALNAALPAPSADDSSSDAAGVSARTMDRHMALRTSAPARAGMVTAAIWLIGLGLVFFVQQQLNFLDRWFVTVGARESVRKLVKEALEQRSSYPMPAWLERDVAAVEGRVTALPARSDVTFDIREQLIVELMSK